jgi:hypothetical protein
MFADAVERALKFTRPVILSRKPIAGDCSAGIGAYVVVNKEGWIVTAAHILEQIFQMDKEVVELRAIKTQRNIIDADGSISGGEKKRRIAQLKKFPQKWTENYSCHWGWLGVQLTQINMIPGVDIGIGKLEPFDPNWISEYPEFKDPARGYRPGTSLCRIGFPFHEFKPTWDSTSNQFMLPPEATPVPIFASEGIIARLMDVRVANQTTPPPFPMKWIETSSPGLKGQSGGPLVDARGTIWAVQSNTYSYRLGFSPKVKHDGKDQIEHQFLNAGRAVHVETIIGLLRQRSVNFQLSGY